MSISRDPDRRSGDIFLTPGTPRRGGLMILNPQGQLVWFRSMTLPRGSHATFEHVLSNLEVQSYRGRPVLTWWQAVGRGEDVIANRSYRTVAVVRAGNGYQTDAHDFVITPQGTAWLVATRGVEANLTSVGGQRHGILHDEAIREIDISTGRVLWQWDASHHIPLNASYASPSHGHYDAYHLNSIQVLANGNLLVSSRNTWSVYEISLRTHQVIWTLGGKYSDFQVSAGARFEWQHDAHLAGSTLTLFDNAATPPEEPQSSAKMIRLDLHDRTARLTHAYVHSPPLLSGSQGNAQRLPNGKVFVGWGDEPDFSEYSASGRQILTGSFASGLRSYRAFRFRWTANPPGRPAIAVQDAAGGGASVWASWNGATNVASWRVLGGSSTTALRPIIKKAFYSFETQIKLNTRPRYVQVEALDRQGRVLGTSGAR